MLLTLLALGNLLSLPVITATRKGSMDLCTGQAISGLRCNFRFCAGVSLVCADLPAGAFFTGAPSPTVFTNEDIRSTAVCPPGTLATGLECKGKFCARVRLLCQAITSGVCSSSASQLAGIRHSEALRLPGQVKGTYTVPIGSYIMGLQCLGRFCEAKDYILATCSIGNSVQNSTQQEPVAQPVPVQTDQQPATGTTALTPVPFQQASLPSTLPPLAPLPSTIQGTVPINGGRLAFSGTVGNGTRATAVSFGRGDRVGVTAVTSALP